MSADAALGELRPDLLRGTLHGRPRDLTMGVALTLLQPLLPLRMIGRERVPKDGPLLVISNHISNADPPLLTIVFPRTIFFMGKSELFRVPILGGSSIDSVGFPSNAALPTELPFVTRWPSWMRASPWASIPKGAARVPGPWSKALRELASSP